MSDAQSVRVGTSTPDASAILDVSGTHGRTISATSYTGRARCYGSGNVFGGYNAGFQNSTGANNTLIGRNADVATGDLTNAGAIGYNAKVGQCNSFVIGGTGADAVRVGIAASSPTTTLHVNGVVAGIQHLNSDGGAGYKRTAATGRRVEKNC